MYTAEEKQAVDQLSAACDKMTETNIKQVDGGYVISQITRYVGPDGIVQGQTVETYVACDLLDIHRVVLDELFPVSPPSRKRARTGVDGET